MLILLYGISYTCRQLYQNAKIIFSYSIYARVDDRPGGGVGVKVSSRDQTMYCCRWYILAVVWCYRPSTYVLHIYSVYPLYPIYSIICPPGPLIFISSLVESSPSPSSCDQHLYASTRDGKGKREKKNFGAYIRTWFAAG